MVTAPPRPCPGPAGFLADEYSLVSGVSWEGHLLSRSGSFWRARCLLECLSSLPRLAGLADRASFLGTR